MGFVENKKLAKDINKVNDECTEDLAELIGNTSALINDVNTALGDISVLEDKYLYRPSIREANTLLEYQTDSSKASSAAVSAIFEAEHTGDVMLCATYEWQNRGTGNMVAGFAIDQVYPVDNNINDILSMQSFFSDADSGEKIFQYGFSVVQGGKYEIKTLLFNKTNSPVTTATVSVRGAVQHFEGVE